MDFKDIRYEVDGGVATVILNRPQYRNVQSWRMIDEFDAALAAAGEDGAVRVIVVGGAGDHFCAGHDLGTEEQLRAEAERGVPARGVERFDLMRRYNLELPLRWRAVAKPTIAMVQGFCIYGGWMMASAMDIIFAAEDAMFLGGQVEYFAVPWDLGPRKAKEVLFESRFVTAAEAEALHMVNRVLPRQDLHRETVAYARRVAENHPMINRMAKLSVNRMVDAQGFASQLEAGFSDYLALTQEIRDYLDEARKERRMPGIDLALRSLRGERPSAAEGDGKAGG